MKGLPSWQKVATTAVIVVVVIWAIKAMSRKNPTGAVAKNLG